MFLTAKPKLLFVAGLSTVLATFLCTAGYAAEFQTQLDSVVHVSNAEKTLSETLVISAPGTVWVKDEHPLITLNEGSLIVIAGKQSVHIKTSAGNLCIPAGLAAMVQQENNSPVRISMIGVRGKIADPDRSKWAVTVNVSDDLVYTLSFGETLLSIPGDNCSDICVVEQSPETREVIKEAVHQLNSIALALNVHGTLWADKVANDCTSILLSVVQGNKINATSQLQNPVRIFIDDGTKFVTLQPDSIYAPTAYRPAASMLAKK